MYQFLQRSFQRVLVGYFTGFLLSSPPPFELDFHCHSWDLSVFGICRYKVCRLFYSVWELLIDSYKIQKFFFTLFWRFHGNEDSNHHPLVWIHFMLIFSRILTFSCLCFVNDSIVLNSLNTGQIKRWLHMIPFWMESKISLRFLQNKSKTDICWSDYWRKWMSWL
jgi:hypothetical protein